MEKPLPQDGESGGEPNIRGEIPAQPTRESLDTHPEVQAPVVRLGRVATVANSMWSVADYITQRHERVTQRNYEKNAENVRARWLVYEQANDYTDVVQNSLLSLRESGYISKNMTCLDVGTADGKSLSDLLGIMDGWDGNLYGLELNAEQYKHSKYWLPLYKRDSERKGDWYMHVKDAAEGKIQPKRARFIEGSVDRLPFTNNSVDLVMALYMLYHLESPTQRKQAIGELHRVMSDDGVLIVSTSGEFNKPKHREIERGAAEHLSERLGVSISPARHMNKNFTTSIAQEELSSEFNYVYSFDYDGSFVIDTEAKFTAYRDSLLSMYDQFNPLPSEEDFRRAIDTILTPIWNSIATDEPFTETLSRSAFVCSNRPLQLNRGFTQVKQEIK